MKNSIEPTTPTLFGHPKGLFYLFFAELWERFSFYGMRSLLILYMTKQLLFSDTMSFGVYATYMSLVYLTPLIGGMLAEKLLGYRKSIILGGILMAIGHFLLAIEQPLFFFSSLALIIVGNGFFKPNISSLVGTLYNKEDVRRDAGFTIFYIGINVGSAVAPLVCALVAVAYGWHYGFALAGIGMISGLICFYKGVKDNVFGNKGLVPDIEKFNKKIFGISNGTLVTILAFLSVPIFTVLMWNYKYQGYLIWIVSILVVIFLSYIYINVSSIEKRRLSVIIYFTILATLFWSVFEQGGSSLTLFASRNVHLVGMNAAQTNSINGTFIILLAIPFSLLWTFLDKKKLNPSTPIKFGIGLILLGLGFVVFALGANEADAFARTPMFFLVAGYFIQTIGELFLSPIGLSKMTELSPPKYIAFIFGVWFLSQFYAQFFAGKIANLTSVKSEETNILSEGISGDIVRSITGLTQAASDKMGSGFQQLYSYVSVYAIFGLIAMSIGAIALVLSPMIKKRMEGIH
jgi:proton-dependent oligopeptide transporter, POT family